MTSDGGMDEDDGYTVATPGLGQPIPVVIIARVEWMNNSVCLRRPWIPTNTDHEPVQVVLVGRCGDSTTGCRSASSDLFGFACPSPKHQPTSARRNTINLISLHGTDGC